MNQRNSCQLVQDNQYNHPFSLYLIRTPVAIHSLRGLIQHITAGAHVLLLNSRSLELTYLVQLTVHGPPLMVPGSRQPLAPLFDLRKQKTSDTSCQVTYSALRQGAWPNTPGGRNDDSTQCQRGSSKRKAWWSRSHHSDREVGGGTYVL